MKIGFVAGGLERVTGGNLYDLKLIECLRAAGEQVEVIAAPAAGFDLLVEDALVRRLTRSPVPRVGLVHYLRSRDRGGLFNLFADSAYLNSLDGFIFNSEATARDAGALLSRPKPSVVAFPGADRFAAEVGAEEIEARAKAKGPLRLLFTGNVIRRKGLHVLLDALARAPRGLWSLTVAGALDLEPAYVRAVRKKIAAAGIAGSVVFRGVLDEQELSAAFRDSQVLAVPSLYEPAGMVYLEALGFGLPVIAGTRGGAGEIVTHGREGFLVRPGDSFGLHNYLGIMINNRSLLSRMSLAALERHKSLPTWEANGRLVRDFLALICRDNKPKIRKNG